MIVTATTHGIKVCVETQYQPEYSSPSQNHFVFTYRIIIENHSESTIKLLRRHWYIHDAVSEMREIEGDGVVGQQPVIEPGDKHEYVSGCNLSSGYGKMYGSYLMEKVTDGKEFMVAIPEFNMIVPYLYN